MPVRSEKAMSALRQAVAVELDYPETDGKPMAETDKHRDLMIELIEQLKTHFQDDPQVYVSGNMLLYYEKGNVKKRLAPDVFVVRGVPKHQRRVYKLWEEGQAPDVVFEISSRGTWGEDLQTKWQRYAQMGIREYFIFDPEYDYLKPALNAYRLVNGEYKQLKSLGGVVTSKTLGLELVDTGETLRLRNPNTGQFLPTIDELRNRAQLAEAELTRIRAELTALKRKESR
jgi:Uma2 family endonuclease